MKPTYPVAAVLLLALLAAGCAAKHAGHLPQQVWMPGESAVVDTSFLRFHYTLREDTTPGDDVAWLLDGRAVAMPGAVPAWARWVASARISAYVVDAAGQVLAEHTLAYEPRPFTPSAGLPLAFRLPVVDEDAPGPWYVAFGYSLVLTEDADGGQRPPFFAGEDAVTR